MTTRLEKINTHSAIGQTRLLRILISESAHLIWRLRCEHVIRNNGVQASAQEIWNQWQGALNMRLDLDCRMTDKCCKKDAISKSVMLETWKGLLSDEKNLPTDWTRETGLLVGIE